MLIEKSVGLAGEAVAFGTALVPFFHYAGSDGTFIAPAEFAARAHAAFAVDVIHGQGGLIVFTPALSNILFLGQIATQGGLVAFAIGTVESAGG